MAHHVDDVDLLFPDAAIALGMGTQEELFPGYVASHSKWLPAPMILLLIGKFLHKTAMLRLLLRMSRAKNGF